MNKIIIANWKANPSTLEEALELFNFSISEAAKYPDVQVVICPPFIYLEEFAKLLQAVNRPSSGLGAQDLFWDKAGPHTGEISVDMLKNLGVTHVLVGHSDRRYPPLGGGESDEVINKKVKAALAVDIVPVLLVGERNHNDDRRVVLEQQLSADLNGLAAEEVSRILITYEPVWAISTQPGAMPDTPESALAAIKIINAFITTNYQLLTANYLYGGSVNQTNVAGFLEQPEISGAVIGGASLRKEEFACILKIVSEAVVHLSRVSYTFS